MVKKINLEKNKFTLIELMVIVAIIMILICLLLPALRKAKEKSHEISCKNNMRQLGMAVINYTMDNNNFLMYGRYYYHSEQSGYILNYLGGIDIRDDYNTGTQVSKISDIMNCPACPVRWEGGGWCSYGVNHYLTHNNTVSSYVPVARLSGLIARNASCIGIFGETNALVGGCYYLKNNLEGKGTTRHNFGANVLFLDGHVKRERQYGVNSVNVAWGYSFEQADSNNFGKPINLTAYSFPPTTSLPELR